MVRAQVQKKHIPFFLLFPGDDAGIQRLMVPGIGLGVRSHLRGPARIILPQGMPFPVVGHEQPAEIGVALETNPEHVENFPLVPVGRRPQIGYVRVVRVFSLQVDFQAQAAGGLEGEQMID